MRLQRRKLDYVRRYKASRGCGMCGEMDPVVLDLHHRDHSTKHPKLHHRKFGKATQRSGGDGWRRLSFEAIDAELAKCDVLCANCHRRVTHRERQEARDRAQGRQMELMLSG